MKRVIKNKKKMKNTMYIVFGTFALLLFMITRTNPSFANEGLIIDDALYMIAEQTIPSDNMSEEDSEVSDGSLESDEDIENPELTPEEKAVEGDENSQDLEGDNDEIEANLDGEDADNGENDENDENEDGDEEGKTEENEGNSETEEVDNQPEVETPEVPSDEESHGVSDNEQSEVENEQDVNKPNNNGYEGSETGSFIANPDAEVQNIIEIESEEIRGEEIYEGVKVEVYAPEGTFPKGTILSIVPITGNDEISDIQDVLEEQKNVEKTEKVIAFDITFLDPETKEELQPLTGTVQVTFNYEENEELKAAEESEDQEVKVYHLNDKDEEGEKVEEITDVIVEEVVVNEEKSEEENVMVVEAERFSVYTIVTQVKEEQLINFEYGMISIPKPSTITASGYPDGFTIMDRNLGATMTGIGLSAPIDSYGYHYQRGNNYGFDSKKNATQISKSGNKVNVSGLSTYSSPFFITGYSSWMQSNNNNLWSAGGQGPCPEGWHVPSGRERSQLLEYYVGNFYPGTSLYTVNGYKIIYDNEDIPSGYIDYFKIPYSKYRSYSSATLSDNRAYYRSTSPNSSYMTYVIIGPDNVTVNAYGSHSYGYTIRCFKDSYIPENENSPFYHLSFDFYGGKGSVMSVAVKSGNLAEKPSDPLRSNSIFSGWYLLGTDIEFDFEHTVISGDVSLYAKWKCVEGYEIKGRNCIMSSNGKSATLLPGESFNKVIKSIAKDGTTGSVSSIRSSDSKITGIKRSNSKKIGVETTISLDNSEYPVYAWFSGGVLYYYSEAGTIFMNEDSSNMFIYLESLIDVNLCEFETSNVTNMRSMFQYCYSLTHIDLSGINTSNVTNMSSMFSNCKNLESIDLNGIDTSNVKNMNSMFSTTSKLKSINFSGLNLSNVTSMSYMFSNGGLKNANFSGLNLSSVTDMSYMFSSCYYLENINFDGVDTSSLVDMTSMFSNCNKLTSLDLSDFDTNNVTSMLYLFQNCSSLISLDVSNWDTKNVTTMTSMFSNCNKLTSLDLSNWDTSSVIYMSYMFQNCSSLTNLYLNGFETSNVTTMFRMFASCNALTNLNIGGWDTSKVSDMREMFKGCSSLTSLDISNWNVSNAGNFSSMFDGCSSLTSLDISNWNVSNAGNFSSMFKGCSTLISLDISNWNVNKAENLSSMFDGCNSLERIYVGKKLRLSSATSSNNMFNNVTSIVGGNGTTYDSSKIDKTYARIDNKYHSGYFTQSGSLVEDVAYLLPGSDFNTKIKSLATGFDVNSHSVEDSLITGFKRYEGDGIPSNVTVDIISSDDSYVPVYAWFDNGVIYYYSDASIIDLNKDSSYMFDMCTSLVNVDFSNLNTSYVTEMNYMFQGCSSLLSMNLSSWDMKNVNYIQYMFSGCKNLEDIDLSNRDVGNIWSARYMFNGCTSLTELKANGWKFSDNSFGFSYLLGGSSIKKVSAKGWILPKDFSSRIGNLTLDTSVIEEIDVSNRDLSRTEKLYDLFYNTPLKKVVGIKTWTGTNEKLLNMSYMFQYAYNIEEVDMSDMDFSKVTTVNEMFQGNSSNPSKLKKINMSNVKFDSLENMEWFCENCYNVEEVDLSNWNMNTQNTLTDMNYAFYDAHNLKKVNLHNFGKVSSTYNMFHNNYSLTELDLSGFDTSNTTDMALMFYGVTGLNTLDFTNQDTSNVTNMDRMFYNTTNLKTIYVSEKFNTDMVTTSNEMFGGTISLVGGNGTKYDPNNIDVTYARIDNEYQSGYFTDPNHFAVRYLTVTGEELLKQWISAGQTIEELEDNHRNYKYYTSGDLQTGFDFTEPLYGYTEIYVTWDDVKHVVYEYGIGVEEGTINSGNCLIIRDNNGVAQSESCEVDLPEINAITGYKTPLWYKKGENITYPNLKITLTGDEILEAKAKIDQFAITFDTDGGNEINPIEIDYNSLLTGLNLPIPTKECNEFSGWENIPETMPAHDITLKAIRNYTCSRFSGGGGKKSETTTREIAIDTNTENEHNSADEKEDTETSEVNKTTLNEETSNQVISVTQEVSEDGTVEAVVETVKIRNTDIIATVRTEVNPSSLSNSTAHTKEQKDAYSFAKSNGITTTKSIETAKMDTELTRIEMAKMVSNYAINVLGQEPDTSKGTVEFKDVTEEMDKQYDNAITKAYQLGIMGQNINNGKFRPNDEVTRAEFSATLSRLLYHTEEGKYRGTGKYYVPHIAKLYNEGIINKVIPTMKEKRGYVMTMLMRTVK